jgi:hypothetical protein
LEHCLLNIFNRRYLHRKEFFIYFPASIQPIFFDIVTMVDAVGNACVLAGSCSHERADESTKQTAKQATNDATDISTHA